MHILSSHTSMSDFNQMQTIKRQMYALRNGIIADSLRKAGAGYKMIFGLNLPQIREVAQSLPPDRALAEELWADRRTRESMLLAPMIYPAEEMDLSTALRWVAETQHTEVADILSHSLLRHLPFAWDMAVTLAGEAEPMKRYMAMRLMWNLLTSHRDDIRPYAAAEAERGEELTRRVASTLVEEIDFLNE